MSFEPPAGILDIGNATLRVGKLEVAETAGLNQGLQNIVKNDLLITEKETYLANKTWGIKLPTAWVGEFDLKTHDNKYVEFNFYNEGSTSNAFGYTLNFKDTTLTLKYDNGNNLASETIPDVSTSTYKKVNVFFERGVIAVFIDGARVLYFKESDTYNSVHGHPGMASRVASTTGGSFVNIFIEADGSDSAVKDLRIVNGRLISDKTSNVSFIGSLGVGVNNPKESLDIRGNMHLTRVSNVSQIKVDSNVVTEYTGPHDRPLRKYPEVALTADADTGSGYKGYKVTTSSVGGGDGTGFYAFDGNYGDASTVWGSGDFYNSSDGDATVSGAASTTVSGVSGAVIGEWIGLQLPNKIRLQDVKIAPQSYAGTTYGPPRTPTKGVVAGSIDGTNWELVHSFTTGGSSQIPLNYLSSIGPINSTKYYNYFRIIAEEVVGGSQWGTRFNIEELCFYGYEEGSASLDTTLKSVYNVPATTGTQLEVYYDGRETSSYSGSGTTVTDISPNTNNGTLNGGVGFDSTYKAFTFDGTDDYIEGTVTTGTGAWSHSIAFWFKIDQIPSVDVSVFQIKDSSVADNADAADHTSPHFIIRSDGTLNNAFMGNPGNFLDDNGNQLVVQTGVWQHYVVQYDASNGGTDYRDRKLIINGNKEYYPAAGTATALNMVASNKLFIGCLARSTGFDYLFNGSIANFRLYSKVLSADQVKELYDYQKDYFLGSKSQVTLYKGHLGVGVTEPSGQLELAGDERIQEYPPGPMTHSDGTATGSQTAGQSKNITYIEGHGEFKASASKWSTGTAGYDGQQPYNAFEDTPNRRWLIYENVGYNATTGAYEDNEYQLSASSGTPYGHWLKLEMPYAVNIRNYYMKANNTSHGAKDWQVWASNDDINWTHIHSYTNETSANSFAGSYYSVSHTGHYKMFAIIVTRIFNASTQDRIDIFRVKYFGTPGPTTLDKGSLTLGRSLDVPRVSRYDVDTETPRPEKLLVDFDTTVNSSPTDISGKGNHGKFYNGASYSPADKAFVFDGTDDYINMNSVSGISDSNPFTVSFWVNVDVNTGERCFMQYGAESTNDSIGVKLNGSYDEIEFFFYANDIRFTWTPDVHRWYHVVARYDGGTDSGVTGGQVGVSRKMWVDGVELLVAPGARATSGTITSPSLPANSDLHIGVRISASGYIDGKISNFKIYNVALEPSEVKKLYNLGRTGRSMVISDTAVGIGKVPEAQLDVRGTIGIDNILWRGGNWTHPLLPEAEFYWNPQSYISKPFSNATTAGSTVTDMNSKMNGIQGNVGWYNNWWENNSTASYIETVSNMDLRRNWTIIIWNKSSGSDRRLAGHGQTNPNDGFHLTSYGTTKIRFGFHGNDVDSSEDYFTDSNTWCQFAATYYHATGATQNRQLFQNERKILDMREGLFSTGSGSGVQTVAYAGSPTPLRFGASYGTGNHAALNNKYGPIAFFGRVLSAGEIRSLYNYFRITWQPGGE